MKRYPEHPQCAEETYVDFDSETQLWCLFGTESGFCYETYAKDYPFID